MLRKKLLVLLLSASMAMTMLAGCGSNSDKKEDTKIEASKDDVSEAKTDSEEADKKPELEDGTYFVDFSTDNSSMFYENPDFNNGKAILTVKDGKMTVHITLNSKNIVNLFLGTAADAQKDGADLIQPTEDTVTYTDGSESKVVYGFNVPVEKLNEDFDLALIGTKGKWYDHKVSVSNPEAVQ